MLRMIVFALAVAAPGLAAAEQFARAAVGTEVRGDDGVVIGHVTAVQRDRHGNIVSVEIPGAEPPDASTVAPRAVARNDDLAALRAFVSRGRDVQAASGERTRLLR